MTAINKSMFINLNEMTQEEFENIKKSEKFEIYSAASVGKFITDISNLIEKGEEGQPLSEEDTMKINFAKSEVSTLHKIVVLDNQLNKSSWYLRAKPEEGKEE